MSEQKQLIDILDKAVQNALINIHTATIAKVIKVNEKTIDVKVVINQQVDGESLELPVFIEVPPVFSQGGGSYTAHPISEGDYCLLIITERCFDNWYSGRDNVVPPEFRIHDYSDAFAIVGINPLEAAILIPQVITHIGDTYQEGNYEHLGDMSRTGDVTHLGDVNRTGDVTHEGNTNQTGDHSTSGNTESGTYSTGGTSGATLSFTDLAGVSHDVINGLIVS